MNRRFWSYIGLLLVALTFQANMGNQILVAQQTSTHSSYPTHLGYRFENFVWWSDEDLRTLLKRRIQGLGDQIATTNAAESQVREALTALLREKGVVAHVQTEEPSYSAVAPQPREIFGMPLPEQPIPLISFQIVTPAVVIGKIKAGTGDEELSSYVQALVSEYEGRPYALGSQAFWRSQIQKALEKRGYLTADATFQHGPPRIENGKVVVDLALLVNAGPQFHIGSISADGGPLLLGRDLSQFFTAKAGDLAGKSPFSQLSTAIRSFYNQTGYADAWANEETRLDREHGLADYHLTVEPGPQYHLRSLTVQKLNAEQEAKVRELLGMKPGDLFRDAAINDLYKKIANEPLLKGYRFGFSPTRDKAVAAIDLTLDFFKDSDESSITIK